MQDIHNPSDTELSAEDKLLLEEYKTLLSSVNSIGEWQHRFATFYFTSSSFLFGAVFLIIKGDFSTKDNLIMITLSLVGLIISFLWFASASRAQVKLDSRVNRAKEIEKHFGTEYGRYVGMFTYTANHLERNENSEGKTLTFAESRRRMLSRKSPMALGSIWLLMVIIGAGLLLF